MNDKDDVDLIALFGLSPEEAGGLGLNAPRSKTTPQAPGASSPSAPHTDQPPLSYEERDAALQVRGDKIISLLDDSTAARRRLQSSPSSASSVAPRDNGPAGRDDATPTTTDSHSGAQGGQTIAQRFMRFTRLSALSNPKDAARPLQDVSPKLATPQDSPPPPNPTSADLPSPLTPPNAKISSRLQQLDSSTRSTTGTVRSPRALEGGFPTDWAPAELDQLPPFFDELDDVPAPPSTRAPADTLVARPSVTTSTPSPTSRSANDVGGDLGQEDVALMALFDTVEAEGPVSTASWPPRFEHHLAPDVLASSVDDVADPRVDVAALFGLSSEEARGLGLAMPEQSLPEHKPAAPAPVSRDEDKALMSLFDEDDDGEAFSSSSDAAPAAGRETSSETPSGLSLETPDVVPLDAGDAPDEENDFDIAALFGLSSEEVRGLGLAAEVPAPSAPLEQDDIRDDPPLTFASASTRETTTALPAEDASLTDIWPRRPLATLWSDSDDDWALIDAEEQEEQALVVAPSSALAPVAASVERTPSVPRPYVSPDLLAAFAEESTELLDGLYVELEQLEQDIRDRDALLETRRSMHTLKGGAKMCGFESIVLLTHSSENLLDLIASGTAPLDRASLDAFFACEPLLRRAISDAIQGDVSAADDDALGDLAATFEALCAPYESFEEQEADTDLDALLASAGVQPASTSPADAAYYVETSERDASTTPKNDALLGMAIDPRPRTQAEQGTPIARAPETGPASSPAASAPLETEVVLPLKPEVEAELSSSEPTALILASSEPPSLLPTTEPTTAAASTAAAPVILAPATEPNPSINSAVPLTAAPPDHLDSGVAETTASTVSVHVPPGAPTEIERGAAVVQSEERAGASRRGPASINVDLTKVEAVVAKVTELAANRASSQGMIDQLMETAEEARHNAARLQAAAVQLGDEIAAMAPTDVNESESEAYSVLNSLSLQVQEAALDQQALVQHVHDTITMHWQLRAAESRSNAEIQSALMSIRLIPIVNMRVRLDAVVRQAARATGKSVRWQLQDGVVSVEKNVFDRLFEPLMHLLRNSVDHGLEAREARLALGKPETGLITVTAVQEGNQIIIAVGDDGAGIDPERIASAAVMRGVADAAQVAAMSPQQKTNLIFTPGFSTAATVSHLSGRGVGMDAVRAACLRMGGAVSVSSVVGQGSVTTMRLPLSLSVTRGLIVRDSGCLMVIPAAQISTLHLVKASDIVTTPHGRVARLDGRRRLPLYSLSLEGRKRDSSAQDGEVNVLQAPFEGGSVGVIVDDVLNEEEVLIKAPPVLLRSLTTLLGAYMMPNGAVAPVINLPQMLAGLHPMMVAHDVQVDESSRTPTALVVDDSMSMRVALTGTLHNVGFRVLTARDGQEALDVLKREGLPTMITLDFEMPRMDGLETLFAIRQLPGAQVLPIFMITSRGGPKHRRAAEQLGATRYFAKPYRDSELVDAANQVYEEAGSA